MTNEKVICLSSLPHGDTYSSTYHGYMSIFEEVANTLDKVRIRVNKAPASWCPLLQFLGCSIHQPRIHFEHDGIVLNSIKEKMQDEVLGEYTLDRLTTEVLSCFRPETVDALWKSERQWRSKRLKQYEGDDKIILITNHNSHYRKDIIRFMSLLKSYRPRKKKVVLVPCFADKPYPLPWHLTIKKLIPEDYYMAVVTGVIGIGPEDLWGELPYYDAGIPNKWRVMRSCENYFKQHQHDQIIVLCDFYNQAIELGLRLAGVKEKAIFVNGFGFRYDYLDLTTNEQLDRLHKCIKGIEL